MSDLLPLPEERKVESTLKHLLYTYLLNDVKDSVLYIPKPTFNAAIVYGLFEATMLPKLGSQPYYEYSYRGYIVKGAKGK